MSGTDKVDFPADLGLHSNSPIETRSDFPITGGGFVNEVLPTGWSVADGKLTIKLPEADTMSFSDEDIKNLLQGSESSGSNKQLVIDRDPNIAVSPDAGTMDSEAERISRCAVDLGWAQPVRTTGGYDDKGLSTLSNTL
jgi:hypothetical protein